MHVFYWQSADGNFGDDLNLWLWDSLMPSDYPKNEDILLCGVGTVLSSRHLPESDKVAVFGSGTGYGDISPKVNVPWCHFYGVRGPLTAKLLHLDESYILSDPAILIPDVLEKPRISDSSRKVIFVPHLESARRCSWDEICDAAGVVYVDPRNDSKKVIRSIASAKLVLAESMHAAIIADAYRVPWIPVWSSREINKFKWTDWGLSVGAKVLPIYLTPPSRIAKFDNWLCEIMMTNDSELESADFNNKVNVDRVIDEFNQFLSYRRNNRRKLLKKVLYKVKSKLMEPTIKFLGNQSKKTSEITVKELLSLKLADGYLSDERQFQAAKERLYKKLDELKLDRTTKFKNIGSKHKHPQDN